MDSTPPRNALSWPCFSLESLGKENEQGTGLAHQALFLECMPSSFGWGPGRAAFLLPASLLPGVSRAWSPSLSQGRRSSTGTPQPGVQCCAKQPASLNRWQSGIAIHHSRKWPTPLPVPQTNGSTPPSLPQSHHLPSLLGSQAEPFYSVSSARRMWG